VGHGVELVGPSGVWSAQVQLRNAAVLGAGSWGTTVADLLARRLPTVLWARSEEVADEVRRSRTNRAYLGDHRLSRSLEATASLEEALEGRSLVVLAVPSHGLREVLKAGAVAVGEGAVVVSLTKGLEETTLARMTEIVAECWPGRSVGVLTGPNLAGEILAGQPAASVVASVDAALARELQRLFGSRSLRVYTNHDVVGCEVAGAAKNVMAIACGMAVGLGLGDNTRGALVTRALAEMARLGVALGGEPLTFSGLAGLGDLVATCTSRRSRNFAVGVALGEGRRLAEVLAGARTVAEGVRTCRPLVELARRHGVEVPVAEQVVAVCHGGRSPRDSLPLLMHRAAKSEFEGVLSR